MFGFCFDDDGEAAVFFKKVVDRTRRHCTFFTVPCFPRAEQLTLPYSRLSPFPLQLGEEGKGKHQDAVGAPQVRQGEHLRPRAALVRARLPRRRQHEGHHRVVQEHRTCVGRPDC